MASKFLNRLTHALQKNKTPPTAPKFAPRIGTLINERYRLEAEIGRGGMGIVYRAHDIPNHRDVAFKILNVENANVLTRRRFLHEVEIHARLHHPHIVAVYETGTIDGATPEPIPFIVLEWVPGPSLDRFSRLTFTKILEIGQQICDVLEYIHQQGVVYRDLKPGNILLETHGFQSFIKLTDFGLARPRGLAYLENESSLAGTTFYLAPELIAGELPDVASDLYALGSTLYELITGRPPFADFDEKTILSQHQNAFVSPPRQSRSDVPPDLEAIVLRLLAKNPQDRFDSAQEVREALEQIIIARAKTASRGNLSQGSADLYQHDHELTQITKLLEANRLVTLIGAAQILARAVGSQLTDQFQDGVWWVDLEPVNEPAEVLAMAASTLGVCPDPHRSLLVSLIDELHEKNLLILLNHCGHLTGACAQLVDTILSTCPDVRILVTSQQPLNLSIEKCHFLSAP